MVVNTRRDQPGYVCSSGRYCVTRKGEVVDAYVEAVTKARLARPDAVELLATSVDGRDVAELRTEALALRRASTRLRSTSPTGP